MQLLAPDLLADMRDLPMVATSVVAAVGVGLWLGGWCWHRFWVVLGTTLAAGIAGLRLAPEYDVQPMVAALLAAVAAGGLALSLARVAVFAGCGLACWYAVHALSPQWSQPVVCILAGGLAGVLCFRFWMILLTSAAGALMLAYSGLVLAELIVQFDAVQWVTANQSWVLTGLGVTAFLGVVLQYLIERSRMRRQRVLEEWEEMHRRQDDVRDYQGRRWWRRFSRAA